MLGIIIGLGASWLLLRLVAGENLGALGLMPDRFRVIDFSAGLFIALICGSLFFLFTAWTQRAAVSIAEYTVQQFMQGAAYVLKSVLFEELLFRGALLYLLNRWLGPWKACLMSAAAFGIYHWFSYGIFGNIVPMVFVFIITSVAGLAFAWAFVKTCSMYLPIALHLGWNAAAMIIFSNGPFPGIVSVTSQQKSTMLASILLLLFQLGGMPLLLLFYLKFMNRRHSLTQ